MRMLNVSEKQEDDGMKTRAIGMAVLALAGALTARGAQFYVATNGNGTTGADWANAYTNVQKALNEAVDGDTIYLASQTFWLTNQIEWTTSGITVRGGYEADPGGASPGNRNPAQWPTVLARSGAGGEHRVMLIDGADNSTLEHVSLTRGSIQAGAGIWIHDSQDVWIGGCAITNNVYDGAARQLDGGGIYVTESSVVMTNCLVASNETRHQGGSTGDASRGGGISNYGTLTVADSVIRNNIVETRDTRRTSQGGGIYSDGPQLFLRNVLLYGNYSIRDQGDGVFVRSGAAALQHCTIADHAGTGVRRSGGTVAMTNCIVWGNWTNIVGVSVTANHSTIGDANYGTYGANNSSADPLFEFGYYLGAGSPCLGAGSDTAGNLGMLGYVRDVAGAAYGAEDPVNRGYHYASGFAVAYPDLYVATDGNDANDGDSWPEAFQTLSHALSLAHAGTRIHVATGIYSSATTGEQYPLPVKDLAGIQILGATTGKTVFDAADTGRRVMAVSGSHRARLAHLTLTGADITDGNAPNNQGAGIRIFNSQHVLISACTISNNVYRGSNHSNYGGGIYSAQSEITVENCRINNNRLARTGSGSSSGSPGGAIWTDGLLAVVNSEIVGNISGGTDRGFNVGGGIFMTGYDLILKNVLIANNEATGTTSGYGDGLYTTRKNRWESQDIKSGDTRLVNGTVAGNKGEGIRRYDGDVTLLNTIVWNNGVNLTGTVASVTYSNIQGAEVYPGEGNMNADPLFVAPGMGDYRLQPGSPSVGTGLIQDWMAGATDLTGNPRVSAGKVDMGCHQLPAPAGTLFMVR